MPRFSKGLQLLASLAVTAIFAIAVYSGYRGGNRDEPTQNLGAPSSSSTTGGSMTTPSNGFPVLAPVPGALIQGRHPLSPASVDERWRHFQKEFGLHFDSTFTLDHRLSHVRAVDRSARPMRGFDSGNKDAALKRAEEVLKVAGPLIGLNSDYPLSARAVSSDEISSQVEWVQAYRGVPIEPYGRITVQLDQNGGLRGLYSNYISDPVIGNEPSLDPVAAKNALISHLDFTVEHPERIGVGELVLFSPGPQVTSSPVILTYGYRYWIEGREVILDAAKGEILSERDRRQF
jgi:hypothetical protein